MKISQALLDDLTKEAKTSPILGIYYSLPNSSKKQAPQRLIAIEPGSQQLIYRHQKSSETVVCLRGRLVVEYYDDLERMCTEAIELSPNGSVASLTIPAGQWHTARALESGTVILEMKDGPNEPLSPADILQ